MKYVNDGISGKIQVVNIKSSAVVCVWVWWLSDFQNVLRDIIYDDGYVIIVSLDRRRRYYAVKFFRGKVGLFFQYLSDNGAMMYLVYRKVRRCWKSKIECIFIQSYSIHSMTEIVYAMYEN